MKIGLISGVPLSLILAGFSVFLTIRIVGFIDSILIVFLLLLLFGFVLAGLKFPYESRVGENVRPVTEPQNRELQRLYKENGVRPRGVWAVDSSSKFTLAEIYGIVPGNRHLFVEDSFFEEFTEGERTAIIARTASLANKYSNIYDNVLVVLVPLIYYGTVTVVGYVPAIGWKTGGQIPYTTELSLLVLYVVAIWYGRQVKYAADRDAVAQTDHETVVRMLEKTNELLDDNEVLVLSLFWTEPSPSKRIDKLRKKYGQARS
jgi:hypothetical protein